MSTLLIFLSSLEIFSKQTGQKTQESGQKNCPVSETGQFSFGRPKKWEIDKTIGWPKRQFSKENPSRFDTHVFMIYSYKCLVHKNVHFYDIRFTHSKRFFLQCGIWNTIVLLHITAKKPRYRIYNTHTNAITRIMCKSSWEKDD